MLARKYVTLPFAQRLTPCAENGLVVEYLESFSQAKNGLDDDDDDVPASAVRGKSGSKRRDLSAEGRDESTVFSRKQLKNSLDEWKASGTSKVFTPGSIHLLAPPLAAEL